MSSAYSFISPVKKGGKRKLVDIEDNVYVEDKAGTGVKYYRCQRGRSEGCLGRGALRDGHFEITKPHDQHSGDKVRAAKFQLRSTMCKASVANNYAPPSAIIQEATCAISEEVAIALPTMNALKRDVQRARAKVFGSVLRPSQIQDLTIPNRVRFTDKGDQFMWWDSYVEDTSLPRIVAFATKKFLETMGSSDTLLMDGTFRCSPRLFQQLYIIHAIVDGFCVPLVYACMEKRDKASYLRLFRSLRRGVQADFTPSCIIVDFECASIAALEEYFETAAVRTCLFHFAQSLLRKIANLGHRQKYLHDEHFRLTIRTFIAFAFIPVSDVRARFTDYRATLSAEYEDFAEYFYRTYIGNSFRPARYPVEMWNVLDRLENDLPRTTNSCEGFHNGLARRIRAIKPDFTRCISQLVKEQSTAEINLTRANAGMPPVEIAKVRKLTENLRRCVATYNQKPLFDFLKGIAHNFHFSYRAQATWNTDQTED